MIALSSFIGFIGVIEFSNLLFTRQLLARKKGVKSGGVKENCDILGLFLILEITPCD